MGNRFRPDTFWKKKLYPKCRLNLHVTPESGEFGNFHLHPPGIVLEPRSAHSQHLAGTGNGPIQRNSHISHAWMWFQDFASLKTAVLEIPILEKFHKNPPRPRCFNKIPGFFFWTLGILELENEEEILGFSFPGGIQLFQADWGTGIPGIRILSQNLGSSRFPILGFQWRIFPKTGKNPEMTRGGTMQECRNF